MVAEAVERSRPKAIPRWVEIRCSNPACRAVLTRYRLLPGAPRQPVLAQEFVCPDRRCRKTQTVQLPPRPN